MTTRTDLNRVSRRDESQSWLLFWLIAILVIVIVSVITGFTVLYLKFTSNQACFNNSLKNTVLLASEDRGAMRELVVSENSARTREQAKSALNKFIAQSKVNDEARRTHPLRFSC